MKVLILITKSNWGGAQRYVYDLATNLPKKAQTEGFDVEVMAGGGGVLIEKLKDAGIKASGDLPVVRDVKIIGDIKMFFKLLKILKEKKPDILHVNSSKIGGIGACAGRVLGIKKIIFTAHGFAFNENRSILSKIAIRFLHWITILMSHKTISVSDALKAQMEDWPMIQNKIVTIHNGIDPQSIFSKTNARYELGKIDSRFDKIVKSIPTKNLVVIGSVGELHKTKGYEYALNGMTGLLENIKHNHPDKKILYVIAGEGENRTNLEKEIDRLELNNSVLLMGNIPHMFQYFRAFDLFLMPSISEGLPYALLEAGLAGLPVISTAVGGIPEMVDDMKSGILIQSRKSKEIEYALDFLINHKRTCGEYSKALNGKILDSFSIKNMIQSTVNVYIQNYQAPKVL